MSRAQPPVPAFSTAKVVPGVPMSDPAAWSDAELLDMLRRWDRMQSTAQIGRRYGATAAEIGAVICAIEDDLDASEGRNHGD